MFRSLGYRNFRLFFLGQLVSNCGAWMQLTAQSWLVYRLTMDPLVLGMVAFTGQFPVFLIGFYSGLMIDRLDRHRLLLWTQAMAMGLAAILTALTLTGAVEVWHVFVLAGLTGIINAFDIPARQVFIGEIVGVEDRSNAIALNSMIVNATRIVGPALAGFLIAAYGEGVCFAVNALSYLAILAGLSLMSDLRQAPSHPPAESLWRDIGDGMGYAMGQEPIRLILFLLILYSLAGLPIYVLLPAFADQVLGAGAQGLGLISSASGLGAALGALLLARMRGSSAFGPLIVKGLFAFGAALGVLALTRTVALACLLMLAAGFAAILILAGANTLLQEHSRERYRGRVMSFHSMIFIGLAPVGSFMMGGIASRIGVARTIGLEAALCMVAAAPFWRRLPAALKHYRRQEPAPPPVTIPPTA